MKPVVDAAPNRAGIEELMSEAYSFASLLRDIRDRPGDSLRVRVGDAVHDCRRLLGRLERAYHELAGGRPVPTRKELWEEERRRQNRVTEADKEALAELVTVMEKHIPRLSPKWQGQFERSRNGLSKQLAESPDAREFHLVNGGK